jgi:hypothetical protein
MVQGAADAAGQLHGGDIGQHLGAVARDHGDALALDHARGLQRLHQLTGAVSDVRVGGDTAAQKQAGFVIVAVEPVDQQVRHQRRVVDGVFRHWLSFGLVQNKSRLAPHWLCGVIQLQRGLRTLLWPACFHDDCSGTGILPSWR